MYIHTYMNCMYFMYVLGVCSMYPGVRSTRSMYLYESYSTVPTMLYISMVNFT